MFFQKQILKILFAAAILILFSVACQLDQIQVSDSNSPLPQSSEKKQNTSREGAARLATKIHMDKSAYPQLRKNCEQLWEVFDKNRNPANWIGLISTIQLNSSGAPCRDFLKKSIEGELNDSFLSQGGKEDSIKRDKKRLKSHFLLQLAYEPEKARVEDFHVLLNTIPELKNGEFFEKATLLQNVTLQNLFCSEMGRALAQKPEDRPKFGKNENFLKECFSREMKRNFLQNQKGKTLTSS